MDPVLRFDNKPSMALCPPFKDKECTLGGMQLMSPVDDWLAMEKAWGSKWPP